MVAIEGCEPDESPLLRELREQQRIVQLMHTTTVGVHTSHDHDEVLERAMGAACEATGAVVARAHVLDGSGGRSLRRVVGSTTPELTDTKEVWLRLVLETGETITNASWIGVPIRAGEEMRGVLELVTPDPVSEEMLSAVGDVGRLIGRGMQRVDFERRVGDEVSLTASFAASAAHDFLNPLAAVGVALATLARAGDRLNDDDRDTLFGAADRGIEELRALVRTLTNLASQEVAGVE